MISQDHVATNDDARPTHPSFREAFAYWLKLGFISFGGPAGQIAVMHQELVEKRRWISEHRFLHALNYCMLLPGPEAQQLCIYIGWLLHRTWGGVVAGTLFVLPYRFADKRGSVVSFSHDYLGGGINPPATRTVVDFEGGGRGFFDMVDRDPEECKVGMKVEMTFRKVRGGSAPGYFWKCKPVRD